MIAPVGYDLSIRLCAALVVCGLASTPTALALPAGYVERTMPLDAPPVGLAFGAEGVLYALEGAAFGDNEATLRTILPNGAYGPSFAVIGDDPENFFVSAIGYDPLTDRVLITDNTGDGRLYAVDGSGARETIATGIPGITGVAVRSSGEIFVSTAPFGFPGEVRVVDRTTGGSSPVVGGLGFGAGLAFDGGDLLVLDSAVTAPYGGRLQRLPISESSSGLTYGAPETLVSDTRAAAGVTMDGEGQIYLTGSGGLFVLEGSPLDDVSFSGNGNPDQFATAISFQPGANPFEPFAGPDSGVLAYMADFGFSMVDSFITLVTPAMPEDFNSDGIVDGDDLDVWTAKFGSTAAGPQSGDADRDGDIDGHDFLRWQRARTAPAPLAGGGRASHAIPEPAASSAFLAAAVLIAWQSRKRR
jgi:hypothetical protein